MKKLLISTAAISLVLSMGCQQDGTPTLTDTDLDGYYLEENDCDDSNADINPVGTEIADGTFADENCNGTVDENVKYMFVSSTTHNGNLGGLAGADTICDDLASAAGLPDGDYMAWLSDSASSPSTRFNQSVIPYVSRDSTQVAANFAQLVNVSSGLDSALMTEAGVVPTVTSQHFVEVAAWTATWTDGTTGFVASSTTGLPGFGMCDDWTREETGVVSPPFGGSATDGFVGFPSVDDERANVWTAWQFPEVNGCAEEFNLICVQQ